MSIPTTMTSRPSMNAGALTMYLLLGALLFSCLAYPLRSTQQRSPSVHPRSPSALCADPLSQLGAQTPPRLSQLLMVLRPLSTMSVKKKTPIASTSIPSATSMRVLTLSPCALRRYIASLVYLSAGVVVCRRVSLRYFACDATDASLYGAAVESVGEVPSALRNYHSYDDEYE